MYVVKSFATNARRRLGATVATVASGANVLDVGMALAELAEGPRPPFFFFCLR